MIDALCPEELSIIHSTSADSILFDARYHTTVASTAALRLSKIQIKFMNTSKPSRHLCAETLTNFTSFSIESSQHKRS